MATALIKPRASTEPAGSAHAEPRRRMSPMAVGLTTAAACIAAVWVATAAALLVLTSVPFWGAVGVGAYAAFWLGGGFGAIFGSAAVFGGGH